MQMYSPLLSAPVMRFMQVSQIFEGKYLSLVIEKWKLILGFAVSIKYFKYLNYHLLVENSFFSFMLDNTHTDEIKIRRSYRLRWRKRILILWDFKFKIKYFNSTLFNFFFSSSSSFRSSFSFPCGFFVFFFPLRFLIFSIFLDSWILKFYARLK